MKKSSHTWITALFFSLALTLAPLALAGDHYFGATAGSWGKLKTKVLPIDASVWVNGKYVGHADQFNGPGQELYLPAGDHEVVFSIAFYNDYKAKVTIEPNRTTVIEQQLARSDEQYPTGPFAKVKIKCPEFDKAAVIVNDRFIGHVDEMNGPNQWLLLMPGTYKIEVQQAGYSPFETTLQAEAGKVRKIDVRLAKDGSGDYSYR